MLYKKILPIGVHVLEQLEAETIEALIAHMVWFIPLLLVCLVIFYLMKKWIEL